MSPTQAPGSLESKSPPPSSLHFCICKGRRCTGATGPAQLCVHPGALAGSDLNPALPLAPRVASHLSEPQFPQL